MSNFKACKLSHSPNYSIKSNSANLKKWKKLEHVTYMPSCSSRDDAMCIVLNNITHKISGNIILASYRHGQKYSTGAASVSIK